MARQPISVAAKVFAVVCGLGPPIGGLVGMALLESFRWATGFYDGSRTLTGVMNTAYGWLQLSYFVGAVPAALCGLALAAWVAWGRPITVFICLAASLIYPAVLALTALFAADADGRNVALLHAGVVGGFSLVASLGCYLLLRAFGLVRITNAAAAGG